jgi:hypothetical protein
MRIEDAFAAAQEDIVGGLSPAFEPVDDDDGNGFEQSKHFRDMTTIADENGEVAAVVWTYRCRHVDWFGTVPPTGEVLTIRGTTVVDNRGGETLFHRYVDWLAVYGDLGYTLYQRQMVDKADWRVINAAQLGR